MKIPLIYTTLHIIKLGTQNKDDILTVANSGSLPGRQLKKGGHWTVKYTDTQSFITTLSDLLSQIPWVLLLSFNWLVH